MGASDDGISADAEEEEERLEGEDEEGVEQGVEMEEEKVEEERLKTMRDHEQVVDVIVLELLRLLIK